jgi:hypothetical protein
MQQSTGGYMTTTTGERLIEEPHESIVWPPHPNDYASPPPGPRMTEEEFQAQFRPKPMITRAPHRKQKLANSDRKAICMYAKQHPNARQEDIAARYNVERSTISKILKNKERWLGCPDDEAKIARKRCVGFVRFLSTVSFASLFALDLQWKTSSGSLPLHLFLSDIQPFLVHLLLCLSVP